jgi:hypothetical protein
LDRRLVQAIRRDCEDAGVAFVDGTLSFGGVLVLDDRGHLAISVANNSTVTGRVVQFDGEQAHLPRHDQLEQALQGFRFNQRHITVQNQHGVGLDEGYSLGHGVTGAQLFVLKDEIQIVSGQALTHGIGAMADHHVDALWIKLSGAVDNMAEHGVAGNRVQYFRQSGTHARALASSENNDFKRHDWLPILGGQRLRPGCKNRKRKKGSRGYPF